MATITAVIILPRPNIEISNECPNAFRAIDNPIAMVNPCVIVRKLGVPFVSFRLIKYAGRKTKKADIPTPVMSDKATKSVMKTIRTLAISNNEIVT